MIGKKRIGTEVWQPRPNEKTCKKTVPKKTTKGNLRSSGAALTKFLGKKTYYTTKKATRATGEETPWRGIVRKKGKGSWGGVEKDQQASRNATVPTRQDV